MSSFSLPARYQSYLGANFFQRQLSSIADALPGVIKRGLSQSPTVNPPDNAGLPDVREIDKPKTNMPLYIGLGVGALALVAILAKGKRSAVKAA